MEKLKFVLWKDSFLQALDYAREHQLKYFGVLVLTEGIDSYEIIINPTSNFDNKRAYYDSAYDDTMHLHSYDAISIAACNSGSYSEIIQYFESLMESTYIEHLKEESIE